MVHHVLEISTAKSSLQNCDIKGPSAVVPVVTNFSNTFLINKPFLSCFEDREKNQKEKTNSTVISDIVPGATMVGGQSGKLPTQVLTE